MNEPKDLKLSEMLGGVVEARVARALQDVASNIDDPNTDAEATRKLVVTLTFKPDAQRKAVRLQASVDAKLAGMSSIKTTVFSTFSREHGCAVLREFNPDQRSIFDKSSGDAVKATEAADEEVS